MLADLTTRRGRVVGTSAGEHGEQEVSALVPTAEIIRYALDLRSITAGRGRFVAQHDHDEILPNNLVSKVKAATAANHNGRREPRRGRSLETRSRTRESSCLIAFASESSWRRSTRPARTRRWRWSATST